MVKINTLKGHAIAGVELSISLNNINEEKKDNTELNKKPVPENDNLNISNPPPKNNNTYSIGIFDTGDAEIQTKGLKVSPDRFNTEFIINNDVIDNKSINLIKENIKSNLIITEHKQINTNEPARPLNQIKVPAEPMNNHGNNISFNPKFMFRPNTNIEELVKIMKWTSTQPGLKIKVGGSLHAFSPVASTNGVFVLPYDTKFFKPVTGKPNMFTFGAGTTIKEINNYLWEKGKSLPSLGGFDGQTIAGVFPTGTHGSMLGTSGMFDFVRSIDLVTPKGDKVRLEKSKGITDPKEFSRTNPGWKLMQNNESFNAALISMGTLGAIHSVTLEATERFYLNEKKIATTGKQIKDVLSGENIYNLIENSQRPPQATERKFPGLPSPTTHLELWWNPYTDKAVAMSKNKVPPEQQAKLEANEPWEFTAPTRELCRTFYRDEYSRPKFSAILLEHFGEKVTDINRFISNLAPSLTPKLVDSVLDATIDEQYINRSYNVFNLGDKENSLPVQAGTLSIPLRGDMYLKAMDIISDTAKRLAKQYGIYENVPISLRFAKGSEALLGEPEDCCKFEILYSGDKEADKNNSKILVTEYYNALRRELGANVRLHWGQKPPGDLDAADIQETFPKLSRFRKVQKTFDPEGRMLSDWQESVLGIKK